MIKVKVARCCKDDRKRQRLLLTFGGVVYYHITKAEARELAKDLMKKVNK